MFNYKDKQEKKCVHCQYGYLPPQKWVCVGLQHEEYNRLLQELKEDHVCYTDAGIGCRSRKSLFICIKLKVSQLSCIVRQAHLMANRRSRTVDGSHRKSLTLR